MLFPLKKQIRPRTPQVDNLRTPVPILFQTRTLKAVERIADPLATAHDAFVLIVPKRALVAYADESGRPHVGVTDRAFPVAFVTEPADCDAGLFAAHYKIGMMAGHGGGLFLSGLLLGLVL